MREILGLMWLMLRDNICLNMHVSASIFIFTSSLNKFCKKSNSLVQFLMVVALAMVKVTIVFLIMSVFQG